MILRGSLLVFPFIDPVEDLPLEVFDAKEFVRRFVPVSDMSNRTRSCFASLTLDFVVVVVGYPPSQLSTKKKMNRY